jgi:hypothetical protein
MTEEELTTFAKTINYITLPWEPRHKLSELPMCDVKSTHYVAAKNVKTIVPQTAQGVHNEVIDRILDLTLWPCLKLQISSIDSQSLIRFFTAYDLFKYFTEDDIFEIFSQLGWADFDPKITKSRIHISKTDSQAIVLRSTLREHGICMNPKFTGSCKNCKIKFKKTT